MSRRVRPGDVALALGTAVLMEPLSARIHRQLGHGPAWFLHRSHHEGVVAGPEANDVIPAVSAAITVGLFALGVSRPRLARLLPVATGATLYGATYFAVHDCYTHRRLPLLPRRLRWLEPFRLAHLAHHRTGTGHWGIFSVERGAAAARVGAPDAGESGGGGGGGSFRARPSVR